MERQKIGVGDNGSGDQGGPGAEMQVPLVQAES